MIGPQLHPYLEERNFIESIPLHDNALQLWTAVNNVPLKTFVNFTILW